MEHGLSLLFRLMSASWILMGDNICEKKTEPSNFEEIEFEEDSFHNSKGSF